VGAYEQYTGEMHDGEPGGSLLSGIEFVVVGCMGYCCIGFQLWWMSQGCFNVAW
jgi:hypothetical protein